MRKAKVDLGVDEGPVRIETIHRGGKQPVLPVVALVGRPNTGKSTLFNRITRSQRAVVDSMPGVTRDRNIAIAKFGAHRFLLIDTGGFEETEHEDLAQAVQSQSLLAAEEADAIILVYDGRTGLTALDRGIFGNIRRFQKPVFIAVNKIDTPSHDGLPGEFFALGVDEVFPISAEHNRNIDDLLEQVVAGFPKPEESDENRDANEDSRVAVAIIGRPNVGKSSLLNRLAGFDRAIVSPIPGTTRDPLDTEVEHRGQRYLLVDTAGIRRRPRVHEYVEKASVVRALRALERSTIGIVLIDAGEGMTEQDARVASYAWDRGRGLGLVINKWDLVPAEKRDAKHFASEIDRRYPSFRDVPKIFISALTGSGIGRIWGLIEKIGAAHSLEIQTARLNEVILRAETQQQPPMVKGKRPRFFYSTQTGKAPPTFTIFTSVPEWVHPTYTRYLENQIRRHFPLEGSPIRIRYRARERR